MKLSEYPTGTIIEIEGYGEYELKMNWCMLDTNDEVFELTEYVDKLQADGVKIEIISVPWGVTERLIEKIWEWQIDAFGSYENGDLDDRDKEAIFEDVVDEYKKLKTAKWLVESEKIRADMRERISKMRKQLGTDNEEV